jgi:cellulose synthase/poly-beta-1,6-N-acetylglucosamine synthase-like glycosyltransferase
MWPETVEKTLVGVFGFVMVMVCLYGLHRYHLVYLYYKHRRNRPVLRSRWEVLPRVTIQLPMYNERYVAQRVIETCCRIDYPSDRLQVQVLDDSTDETTEMARETLERMRAAGHDVELLHRTERRGFKAGALEEGLRSAKGEFVCIFDADFLPPAEILRETIHYFVDPQIGMVQARWDHINRDQSLLTKSQAVLLDGHFVMEHGARNRSGRFMSFNGTAGVWRKSCIVDAGGWEHDTLTEDLDLSYRAQMKGWKFLFLPDLSSPAELPPEMEAFKAQQRRWAKGGAQTCRKLLPRILRSSFPAKIKLEAFFHLTSWTVYLYMVALTGLILPILLMGLNRGGGWSLGHVLLDLSLFIVATCSASTFYVCSQRELFRTWAESLKYLPFLMSLGIGISLNNALAALRGFLGHQSEFVRTPKFGLEHESQEGWQTRTAYRPKRRGRLQAFIELGMGVYMLGCMALSIEQGWITIGLPFMALFALGYFYVGGMTLAGATALSTRPASADPAAARARHADPVPEQPQRDCEKQSSRTRSQM